MPLLAYRLLLSPHFGCGTRDLVNPLNLRQMGLGVAEPQCGYCGGGVHPDTNAPTDPRYELILFTSFSVPQISMQVPIFATSSDDAFVESAVMDPSLLFDEAHVETDANLIVAKAPSMIQTRVTKRKKYTIKACHDCKRRKVKCTGEEICLQCRNRSVQCRYSPAPSNDAEDRSETSRSVGYTTVRLKDPDNVPRKRARRSSGYADPRVDMICDRLGVLERNISYLFDMVKQPDRCNEESPVAFQKLVLPSETTEDEGANLFAIHDSPSNDLSLSSQVAAINTLMSRATSPKLGKALKNNKFQIMVEFPDPPSLSHLLNVYFRDFDCYFPFLDRRETEPRIYQHIRRLGYSSYNCKLPATIEDLPTAALACSMLAMAACLDSGDDACDGNTRPGWDLYLQSCRIMHHIVHFKTVSLDVVQAQCLIASYLMYSELLSAASRAVFLGLQLATSIQLNNQSTWPTGDTGGAIQRQQVWWTLYYLDRQIARKAGSVYHIRDIEFDVEDFGNQIQPPNNKVVDSTTNCSRSYMQALVNLAKLWGNIWDSFFATGTKSKGDWMEVEIMDTQILNSRRQLAEGLSWDTEKIGQYVLNNESETHIRRRLQLYTRSDLLRALIRHNPARKSAYNPETAHLCARLSRQIIHAHDTFITRFPGVRAIGYFTTACIVECIYHLVPILHYSAGYEEHKACVESLNQAHGILIKISRKTNVAKRALEAVGHAMKRWGTPKSCLDDDDIQVDKNDAEENEPMSSKGEDLGVPDLQLDLNGATFDPQIGMDAFDIDFGEWANGPMGTLFNSDLDFRTSFQL